MPRPDSLVVRSRTTLTARDGTPLFVRHYELAGRSADRVFLIVHGTGEHGERYDHFARLAARRGWRVVAGDLRGHGRSGGTPTHLLRFEQYLDDLDVLVDWLAVPADRLVMLAHSMGGLAGIRYAQTRPGRLSSLVPLSPLLAMRVPVAGWKIALGRLCLLVAPATRFRSPITADQVTRCHEARRTRELDPLRHATVTASWYFRVLDAMYEAWSDAPSLKLPLLLLQGEQDEVVCPTAPLRWWPSVGSADKSLVTLKDHLHELLTEPDWQHTADLVLRWADKRVPSQTSVLLERGAPRRPSRGRDAADRREPIPLAGFAFDLAAQALRKAG